MCKDKTPYVLKGRNIKMSKQDLINFMAEDAGMSKAEAGRAID